ncbi:protocatechuate 3,4-dioxygenase subunit alpha [Corynebacterium suedekumii]|uniref:Protocatechuate 3,4-dioxygenase subunit alpha n=1 Tax=Corynebacterium suedekumii TaxID=3049801 RepID=A0ABY8VL54_9CORY|nr:protocatechuate 3,4-dioxygenase subunit alpha [Corynebacterium suedekumii]WIM70380.1 protocatechuate 3,4-dioxygenase subunit alpha [Corynebacterium suedekumii]
MIDTHKTGEFRYDVSDIRDQDEAEFGITPSQTVGPYVHIGLTLEGSELIAPDDAADTVEVTVSVTDGNGDPVADAMIEIWQTRPDGTYNTDEVDGFRGLGRGMVDDTGAVTFTTLVPGATDEEAPHLKVGVFARGMLERLYTRLYFPENAEANAADPVLALVDAARRDLLAARAVDGGYRLDIVVQHEDAEKETPFFRV